jgi:hypothetical protein
MKIIYLILILLGGSLGVHAATVTAASASRVDIWAAMDLVNPSGDGDELVIPAGTGSWTVGTNYWVAPRNFTIRGAGTSATGGGDQTVIVDDSAFNAALFGIIVTNGGFRMTGITFRNDTGALKDGGIVVFHGGYNPMRIRVDHCRFATTNLTETKALVLSGGVFGVLDHCVLDFQGYSAIYLFNGRSGPWEGQGNLEWASPTDFGGTNYFFIEDNIITGYARGVWTSFASRIYDGFTGAKVVTRFNTMTNICVGETHATGHAPDDRGLRSQEAYGNAVYSTHVADGKEPNFALLDMKNGTSLAWGNTMDQVYKSLFHLQISRKGSATYTQAPTPTGWGYVGPAPIATGTASVNGTAVTKTGGTDFDVTWPAGTMIYITDAVGEGIFGQAPADGPSLSIASVNSTTSITLANGGHTGANLTGKTWVVGSGWDGNDDGYGYPALDQPGRGMGDLLTNNFPNKVNFETGIIDWPNQALEPIYFWNNSGSIVAGYGGAVYANQDTLRIVANRDYYPQASGIQTSPTSPFDGTTGTGWGPLANRPTTCTAGVAYFATDQGSWNTSASNPYGVQQNGADGVLYVATAPDTWTLYYTPYTYPHPLNDGVVVDTGTPGTRGKTNRGNRRR